MRTKEEVEDVCRRMENLLETLRKYTGAEAHECGRLMNWFINQVPNIRCFSKNGMQDGVDEVYRGSLRLIDEAAAFVHKHDLC